MGYGLIQVRPCARTALAFGDPRYNLFLPFVDNFVHKNDAREEDPSERVPRAEDSRQETEQEIPPMINVTPAAATKIHELLTEENKTEAGLRVFVQGGGCS